jgi:hypothetical protein
MTIKIKLHEQSVPFETLKGKTFTSVTSDDESITFIGDGIQFKLKHCQECCEDVHIESIVGDLDDLIGSEILVAEESSKDGESEFEVEQWTFYKLATVKGWVDVRFYGSSNGYYSTSVDLMTEPLVDIEDFELVESPVAFLSKGWHVRDQNGLNFWITKPYQYDKDNGGYLSVVDGKVVFSYTKPE